MTTRSLVDLKASFASIRKGLANIEDGVAAVAAGVLAVLEVHGPGTIEALQVEFPGVPSTFWQAILAVANGKLHPRVVATGCSGIRYISRLSLLDQERAIEVGVPVAVPNTDDYRLIPAHLLTASEINRAISPEGALRTLAEQAAHDRNERDCYAQRRQEYLESLRTEPADVPDEDHKAIVWRVEGSRVHILSCPLRMTKADLRKLLRSLE